MGQKGLIVSTIVWAIVDTGTDDKCYIFKKLTRNLITRYEAVVIFESMTKFDLHISIPKYLRHYFLLLFEQSFGLSMCKKRTY